MDNFLQLVYDKIYALNQAGLGDQMSVILMNSTGYLQRVVFIFLLFVTLFSVSQTGFTSGLTPPITASVRKDGDPVKPPATGGGWSSDHNNTAHQAIIRNWDGRIEQFWLDSDPGGWGGGKIRHQYQWGFGWWSDHYDFEGGVAKEMVVAKNNAGKIIVAHIGTDNRFYWRAQITPGGAWTSGWNSMLYGSTMYYSRTVTDRSYTQWSNLHVVTQDRSSKYVDEFGGLEFRARADGLDYSIRIYDSNFANSVLICRRPYTYFDRQEGNKSICR